MKVAIITQPLFRNYGGILQNYALQQTLLRLGHEPITFDYVMTAKRRVRIRLGIKQRLFSLIGVKRDYSRRLGPHFRNGVFEEFVSKHIALSRSMIGYDASALKEYNVDAIVVGSDQVWRPRYNIDLHDMYLRFARHSDIIKIAYAASFGVNHWEYKLAKSNMARKLIRQFKAISVREASGIALCNKQLKMEATEVLDPTLLLSSSDYNRLCAHIPAPSKRRLFAYILDMTPEKQALVERIAANHNLEIEYAKEGTIAVEEWVAAFRDAEYVVTDSFHGSIFSIIYRKEFLSIVNIDRGASRFESLLSKFDLTDRIVTDMEITTIPKVDWEGVEKRLQEWQDISLSFLNNNLSYE